MSIVICSLSKKKILLHTISPTETHNKKKKPTGIFYNVACEVLYIIEDVRIFNQSRYDFSFTADVLFTHDGIQHSQHDSLLLLLSIISNPVALSRLKMCLRASRHVSFYFGIWLYFIKSFVLHAIFYGAFGLILQGYTLPVLGSRNHRIIHKSLIFTLLIFTSILINR